MMADSPSGGTLAGMRQARIKIPASENEASYHCISRTVNGEWLFDDTAKDVLRRQLWQVADYCGVQITTYTVMSNHFHVLLHVPKSAPIADAELLRRYKVLYPKPTKYQSAQLSVVEAELTANGPVANEWRRRQLALMGDVSQFMKLVKQRFSIWFNKWHRRFGTLWAERFKSVLIDSAEQVLRTVAAYIDLNSVRAGLVADPKDYRFCGYAEAVAGMVKAREGIRSIIGGLHWDDAHAHYRELLFGTAAEARDGAAAIAPEELQRVISAGGRLPLSTALRCRLRYLTDGAILGTQAFVQLHLATHRQTTGRRRKISPRALPVCTDWDGWATLRTLRRRAFG